MRRRLFNALTLCSTVTFCVLGAGCFLAHGQNRSFIAWRGLSVGLTSWYGPTRVEMFNDLGFGPYRGGIIEVTSPGGQPARVQSSGFNFLDIYFRHLRWPGDGRSVWTLSFGLIDLVLLAVPMPTLWLVHQLRRVKQGFPVVRPTEAV